MGSNQDNHTQETKKGRGVVKHPPFLATIIQKKENVENLSFQHFQQVFNNKLHKEIRHYDEHSTFQQVFNKSFNIEICLFFTMLRFKFMVFNFSTAPTTTTTTSYI